MAETTAGAKFSISPEKEASKLQLLRRQLFATPPAVTDVDLNGKTAIVTGANRGLGLECCRQLIDLGLSKLIITGRDQARSTAVVEQLLSESDRVPAPVIEPWNLDLLSYDSITSFVKRAEAELPSVDIVILNAGIFREKMHINPSTGHEEDVQTNYLSNMLLLLLFLRVFSKRSPAVAEAARPKITVVSSDTAAWAKFKERSQSPPNSVLDALDKLPLEKWDMMERYGTSKLLGQLFVTKLVKHVKPSIAVVNLANPGLCYGSGLARDQHGTFVGRFTNGAFRVLGRSLTLGARVIVDAAVRKGVESHGQYVEDGEIRPMAPLVYQSEGEEVAERLWDETMDELAFAGTRDIIRELQEKV
ncbi:NAD(P)-binding protein-8 [Rhypophila sp. PSN 637]